MFTLNNSVQIWKVFLLFHYKTEATATLIIQSTFWFTLINNVYFFILNYFVLRSNPFLI